MSDLAWMRPKLAELCGYCSDASGYYDGKTPLTGNFIVSPDLWRPDENVGQASRCIEALGKPADIIFRKNSGWNVMVFGSGGNPRGIDTSFSRAIVLAIAAALGWEKS